MDYNTTDDVEEHIAAQERQCNNTFSDDFIKVSWWFHGSMCYIQREVIHVKVCTKIHGRCVLTNIDGRSGNRS